MKLPEALSQPPKTDFLPFLENVSDCQNSCECKGIENVVLLYPQVYHHMRKLI